MFNLWGFCLGSVSDISKDSKGGFYHDPFESMLLIDFIIDFKFFDSRSDYFRFFFNKVDFHLFPLDSQEFDETFDIDILYPIEVFLFLL